MPNLMIYPKYIKELLKLALPMIMGNLGMILIGAGDVFVAAKHSTETLAAISIATSVTSIVFLFGIGLLVSISPLLSNFRGEKNEIKKYFLPTINYSMILALFSALVIILCIPLMKMLGFEKHLLPDIETYMFICAFSTFGAYLQAGLKEFLQAYEIVLFPNIINILGVFVNVFLNFVFVFGLYGFPEMGATGLAVATVLSRTLLGITLLIFCLRFIKVKKYHDFTYFMKLLKIGLPIAVSILLEVGAFNLITILIARISGVYAAAQNILLTLSTATFMIPMAISNSIAVKVGFANGAKNFDALKKYAASGIFISVSFMAFCAINFILFPKFFVQIFTFDNQIVKICVPILMLAGIFQIFDGAQVSLGGVFKGLKQTNIVMFGNFLAYWLIGLPLGAILAFHFNMELYGFWVGLTVAIFSLSIMLSYILYKKINNNRADF